MKIDEAVRRKAKRQYGLISRAQAIELGLSLSGIDRRGRSGEWQKLFPRVYRLAGSAESPEQRTFGACLCLGPAALASHSTAAFLWGLDGVGPRFPNPIEISAPREVRCSLEGVVVHYPRDLLLAGKSRQKEIPVTHLARTVLDLASHGDARLLERAFDSALRKRRGFPQWMLKYLAEVGARGRSGVHALQELARVRLARPTDSANEVDVLGKIRQARLPLPTLQHNIFDERGFVARVDFAWVAQRMVLFADSWAHHQSRESFDHDHEQRERLAACGWTSVEVSPRLVEGGSWLESLARHLRRVQPDSERGKRTAVPG
jgi:hypothetical protein